jgi:hypothetical protein
MSKLKMAFCIDELPTPAAKRLANGYCIDDDPDHLWFDTDAILDGIAEGRFPGVTYDAGMETIPAAWWKLMKFEPKMERKIKKFLKENPNGEVEFSW